jgi:hypothetical protein
MLEEARLKRDDEASGGVASTPLFLSQTIPAQAGIQIFTLRWIVR